MDYPPSWPIFLFYGISIPSLPLYIMVLICLIKLRFHSKTYQSTFYTILMQHSIADIGIMIFYTTNLGLRTKPGIREILYSNEHFVAATLYNSIYYTLYIRCTGIVFLSLHRFLVISAPTHRLTLMVQEAATWKIVAVYWIVPTLISLIVLKNTDVYYNSMEELEYVVPKDILSRNTLTAMLILSSMCLICVICYISLWITIRKHQNGSQKSFKREIYLAFQVLLLLCAFFVMYAYYLAVKYFSQAQNTEPVFYIRTFYPIANGILSYINPYCILILNREFLKQFKAMLKCQLLNKKCKRIAIVPSGILNHAFRASSSQISHNS
eukprot:NP_500949.2 Serpentine Receptor, class V [Caenorhabditis elegans]